MKPWKIALLSAAAAALLLSGCGEKKSSEESTTTKSETRTEAPAPVKPVEVPAKPATQEPEAVAEAAKAEKPAPKPLQKPADAVAQGKAEVEEQVKMIDESVQAEAEKAKMAATEKAEETKKTIDAAVLFTKCAGCHGMKGEKHALGQSNVIAGQSKEDLVKKIAGYQKGTYGGAMKGLMQGQVKSLSPEEVEALADYIAKF